MRTRFVCLLLLGLVHVAALGQSMNVAFMGIVPGDAPSFEKRLERGVLERLAVMNGLVLADRNDVEEMKVRSGFLDDPAISRRLVAWLLEYWDEKTLVAWAQVSDFSIRPIRRMLIGAAALGTARVTVTLYGLKFKQHLYLGDILCESRIPKSLVFFRDPRKVTHISASDRTTIIRELGDLAAARVASAVDAVVKGQLMRSGFVGGLGIEEKEVPSISDLFEIPSVEAAEVDEKAGPPDEAQKEEPLPEPEVVEPLLESGEEENAAPAQVE